MRLFSGILLLGASLFAQNPDIIANIKEFQGRPAIAIPDFRGAAGAAQFAKTFNDTLWSEISDSGALKMIPKSYYPLIVPQQPQDFHVGSAALTDWLNPPVKANYLAFGYLSAQDANTLVLFGWLDNVGQPDPTSAQLFGRRYYGPLNDEGAKKVAGLSDSDIVKVDAGEVFKVGELEVKYLHTPGHTPGSQCFLVEGNLIAGDTLFVNSCGRVDLPGSDPEAMYYSLNQTLKNLPDETVVYPGHAYSNEPSSTIGKQKRTNMYMRFPTLDDFLDAMGYSR